MVQQDSIRYHIIRTIIILTGLILIIKMAALQLFDTKYSKKADNTTLNQNVIIPSRGLFVDRKGQILVINYPAYDIYVQYKNVKQGMDTVHFCALLGITKQDFLRNLEKDFNSKKYSRSVPFVFMKNVDSDKFARFQEYLYKFPGFSAELRSIREYPQSSGAHFLGYISEVTQSEIDNSSGVYRLADYIGTVGLEREYEELIRGEKGVQFVLKDKIGREVGPFQDGKLDRPAKSGLDIQISIDLELQRYAETLMTHKVGSIVALEPSSGEVLAMVTSPFYNPNLLAIHSNRGRAFAHLLRDTLKPMFDRSIMAKYPPGSIFKPILALAAMQEGIMYEDSKYPCPGAYYYKNLTVGCHNHPTPYNIQTALQHSCNTYFIHVFRNFIEKEGFANPEPGMNTLVKYLEAFGLGSKLGFDNANENSGFIPTSEYYTKVYKPDKWRSPYVVSLAIGQGEFQLTTLQMANLAAIIANRGTYITPHLIKGFINQNIPIPERYRTRYQVPVDRKHFAPVIEGMYRAVESGTASTAFDAELGICGKTGTSQNPHGEDHSVFFAFAPKDNPKIAIAVYVENAGWGGTVAAPIASLMIEKYLNKLVKRQALQKRMTEKDLIKKVTS